MRELHKILVLKYLNECNKKLNEVNNGEKLSFSMKKKNVYSRFI